MEKIYDIIVVGGGIAGLHFASLMKKQGRNVLVLEAKEKIERKICGEYLCPKGVQLLQNQGLGFLLEGFEGLYGMKMVSGGGTIVESFFPETEQKNYGVSVHRKIFEERLLKYYQELGGEIKFSCPVKNINTQLDIIRLECEHGFFNARFVVGADGRKSRVARFFNVIKEEKQTRVAVHAYVPPLKKVPRLGQMHLFENGSYIGVDPIQNNEINLSLVCDASDLKNGIEPRDVLNSYIKKSEDLMLQVGLLSEETQVWTVYPLRFEVSSVSDKKFALIGDASGFVDPLTGEGMYNALLSAQLLAESIAHYGKIFDYSEASKKYSYIKNKITSEKKRLNLFFQWFIRKPVLVELLAFFLSLSQKSANHFVGIIGNVHRPIIGFLKMIF